MQKWSVLIHDALALLSRAQKSGSHSGHKITDLFLKYIEANFYSKKINSRYLRNKSVILCPLWDPLFLARLRLGKASSFKLIKITIVNQ